MIQSIKHIKVIKVSISSILFFHSTESIYLLKSHLKLKYSTHVNPFKKYELSFRHFKTSNLDWRMIWYEGESYPMFTAYISFLHDVVFEFAVMFLWQIKSKSKFFWSTVSIILFHSLAMWRRYHSIWKKMKQKNVSWLTRY